jgi:DNA (cytosine-5)-methyltransferase 1
MKPRLLDLFCGAGGAGMGYHLAGFEVVGVDIEPQANYPFEFVQADAMTFPLDGFDAIHASPPCQAFSNARVIHGVEHPDLLTPTRPRLQQSGVPWVIENVPGSPMRPDFVLCGSMFPDLRSANGKLIRHRWFETSWQGFAMHLACSHEGPTISVFGHGGHIYHGAEDWRQVMGIDWMTRDEMAQAIPPAYTEHIGVQLLAHLDSVSCLT